MKEYKDSKDFFNRTIALQDVLRTCDFCKSFWTHPNTEEEYCTKESPKRYLELHDIQKGCEQFMYNGKQISLREYRVLPNLHKLRIEDPFKVIKKFAGEDITPYYNLDELQIISAFLDGWEKCLRRMPSTPVKTHNYKRPRTLSVGFSKKGVLELFDEGTKEVVERCFERRIKNRF